MTALVGGDSKGKVSAVAGAVCRLPSFQPHNAGGEDLGDLIKALGGGHQVGIEGVLHGRGLLETRWRRG